MEQSRLFTTQEHTEEYRKLIDVSDDFLQWSTELWEFCCLQLFLARLSPGAAAGDGAGWCRKWSSPHKSCFDVLEQGGQLIASVAKPQQDCLTMDIYEHTRIAKVWFWDLEQNAIELHMCPPTCTASLTPAQVMFLPP